MIDVNLPLELDDGTPMEVLSVKSERSVRVRPKLGGQNYADRDGLRPFGGGFYYRKKDGIFIGGDEKTFKVLRNVDEGPVVEEDWS